MPKYKTLRYFIFQRADFLRNEGGVAFIEIAVSLPLLFIMLFGIIELSDYIILTKRAGLAASTVANIITTVQPASASNQLAQSQITSAANIASVMAPYPVDTSTAQYGHTGQYRVFVIDISRVSGSAVVNWIYDSASVQGTGGQAQGSDLGASGNTSFQFSATQQSINPLTCSANAAIIAQSLNGFTFTYDGEEIIVVNFYYTYNSITNLLTITPGIPLLPYYHSVAIFNPRSPGYNNSGNSSITVPPTGSAITACS